jgi:hypothetical protein
VGEKKHFGSLKANKGGVAKGWYPRVCLRNKENTGMVWLKIFRVPNDHCWSINWISATGNIFPSGCLQLALLL